ncbi:MAG TPA: lipopolysaccharide biosynthesis protein [Fibrobacteria bacterium]|nr:lipopolysaccharide biosynthesis protein [Fibrobacteria bacterium]
MARGAVWMILFKWVERGLGLVSTLILVRLLSPADFGMVSMALSFIFMAELLSAFSFDIALIQNQAVTDEHYHSAWTANIMLGGFISVLMLGLALPISHFYKQPAVFPVICALSLGPLLGSLENIGIVAFRRNLDFRREFIFQVSRKIIATSVTIPLALALHSYWALVAGILASKAGGTAMSYWVQAFRPRLSFKEVGSLMSFSRWLLLNNFVNFLKERSTDFVIGRFFGPGPLGMYNVNNEFASMASNEMGQPINRALLPGFAKLAGDEKAISRTFANAAGMVAVLAVPAAAGIFAVAPYLVPVVLGAKWLPGVPVMEVLSLNSALVVFQGTIVTALVATGNPFAATSTNVLFVALLLAGMFLLTGRFGPLGAAFAVFAACAATTPVFLWQLKRHARVPVSNFFRVTVRPALASAAMIAAVRWALPAYVPGMGSARAGLLLACGVGMGVLVYACAMLALWTSMGRPDGAEKQVFSRLKSRVPAWMPIPG